MGRDVHRILQDQRSREAARADHKHLWRALTLATSGAILPPCARASKLLAQWACNKLRPGLGSG